jgi:hypothetical protein
LVMVITNDVFCNRYGYDRQGKKRNFLRHPKNIWGRAFPVLWYSCRQTAVRALSIEFFGTDWVSYAGGTHC